MEISIESFYKYARHHIACITMLLLSLSSLIACGGGSNDNVDKGIALDSDEIGLGITPNDQLHHSIEANLLNPDALIKLDNAYISRFSTASDAIYWSIGVHNESNSESFCFVKLRNINFKTRNGDQLASSALTFVHGSVHVLKLSTRDVYTNTCLDPNENGHFIGIELSGYSQADHIEIESIERVSMNKPVASELFIEAIDYKTNPPNDTYQNMVVDIVNRSTVDGKVNLSFYLILDSQSTPLIWGSLNRPDLSALALSKNETSQLTDSVYFDGTGNKLLVYLDYEAIETSAPMNTDIPITKLDFSTEDEYLKALFAQRNNTIQNRLLEIDSQ